MPEQIIVGIDEVGRGCWAGPVVVGAFVYRVGDDQVLGVTDSKLLTAAKRERLAIELANSQHIIKSADPSEIDSTSITKAIIKLINEILLEIPQENTRIIIDGKFNTVWPANVIEEYKADLNHYPVAAASILAKVYRDNEMAQKYEKLYPGYGFAQHKGYGTALHQKMLVTQGVSPIHRRSYAPIAALLS